MFILELGRASLKMKYFSTGHYIVDDKIYCESHARAAKACQQVEQQQIHPQRQQQPRNNQVQSYQVMH